MPAVRQIGRRRFAWNLPLNEVRWTRSSPRTGGVLHAYPSIAKAAWQSRLSDSFYWPLPVNLSITMRSARWPAVPDDKRRRCGVVAWLATAVLIPGAVLLFAPSDWPRWLVMWTLAFTIYCGCKWLTWRRTPAD